MYVVFLHGPPAAGKHTVGELLASRLDIALFHNHLTVDLVTSLFGFGTPGFIALREAVWLQAFGVAARERRSFVFTFNPEASVDPDLIPRLVGSIESAGGRIHFVELHCTDAVVESRLGLASRARFGKLTDLALYRRIRADGGFAFPPLPPALIRVDTGPVAAPDAADRIAQAIHSVENGAADAHR